MANLGGAFDARNVEPNAPFEIIPAGDYTAQIIASSMEQTKNGRGEFLKLEIEITDGPQAGRKLFDRLNLVNDNAQAAEIAQRTLSAICHAVGKLTITDSEELHMLPFGIKVAVTERKDRPGEYSNEVKGYKPAGGASAPAPAFQRPAAASTPAAAKPAAGSPPPWKRNAA